VTLLTAFGDDDFGRRARENGRGEGIDLGHAKDVTGLANQVALIFVGDDGQNLIGVAPGASTHLSPEDIDRLPEAVFAPGAVFLASLEVPLETVARGLERARAAGMTTALNPAPAEGALVNGEIRPRVDVLTPNQEEARALTGIPIVHPRDAARAAADLQVKCGARAVVVTRGAEGCVVVRDDGAFLVPPHRVGRRRHRSAPATPSTGR
jgi:ribokinase